MIHTKFVFVSLVIFSIARLCCGLGSLGVDLVGDDITKISVASPGECGIACDNNDACVGWSFNTCDGTSCWLKATIVRRQVDNCREVAVKLGEKGKDRDGMDLPGMPMKINGTASSCAFMCDLNPRCVSWAYDSCGKTNCWLKGTIGINVVDNSCRISAAHGHVGVDQSNSDIDGSPYTLDPGASSTQCSEKCAHTNGCVGWVMVNPGEKCEMDNLCWLKSSNNTNANNNTCRISGFQAPGVGPVVSSKVGLAWPDGDSDRLSALAGSGRKPSWLYTWGPFNIKQTSALGIEFVPMLWGPGQHLTDFINEGNAGHFAAATHILGFNEPDNKGQANLSPQDATNLWRQYMQPWASKGKKLGAPAVTSAPSGKSFLQGFFSACSGCTVDFIPIHWYGSNPQYFMDYVSDIHNSFGKPIWVTEWACYPYDAGHDCSQGSVNDFMSRTTTFLDQQSFVERYSYFGAMRSTGWVPDTNRLLTTDGQNPTDLGNQYARGGH